MLQQPLWKQLTVIAICLAGIVIALPNAFYGRVERANDARAAIPPSVRRGVRKALGRERDTQP